MIGIYLANPRGFCAGVDRAIEIVNRALEKHGAPVYVKHEVVHNRSVVDSLRAAGAVFVEDIAEIPANSLVIFSAHGVSRQVQSEARARGLRVYDATCPLVTKVHLEVVKFAGQGREMVLIGHAGHPEVEGTLGQYESDESAVYLVETVDDVDRLVVSNPEQLSYVTQTTLSVDDTRRIVDALKKRFPEISGPRKDDICYATQNRQDAVKMLTERCDLVLVVGSQNSSNSNRLCELAQKLGRTAYLIDDETEVDAAWLDGISNVGVTSGASAPEAIVRRVISRLEALGCRFEAELDGAAESMSFALPRPLR
jgi:4-hydroxy-3-methylbut-2-enyl diphosphate reductase